MADRLARSMRAVAWDEVWVNPLSLARRGAGKLTVSGETRPERCALALEVLDQTDRICLH
jgi:hypothetical protein